MGTWMLRGRRQHRAGESGEPLTVQLHEGEKRRQTGEGEAFDGWLSSQSCKSRNYKDLAARSQKHIKQSFGDLD